jgi:YD repeat-containing protein
LTYDDAGHLSEQISVVNGETSVVRYTYDEHGNSVGHRIMSGNTLKAKGTNTYVEVKVSAKRAEELKKTQGRPQVSVEYTFGYYGDDGFIPS